MKPLLGTKASPATVHFALLLLRIGASALMLTHGWPKFTKLITGNFTFGDPIGIGSAPSLILATLAEFGCSVLILLGFQTRLAAIVLMVNMLVVVFFAHGSDPFGKKEMPLLFFLIYLTIYFVGPGKHSMDGRENKTWPG
ncbi:DoxX family protein [Larkinella terrae]|uniref:DoxX family membrane protein n=1 Tax=Larkinella terrae TaxID=2025311 RepID=A0A7K0EKQ5_9BACT|nr:DoxX family protein [Larkinella terrae]MRS62389.1 DoxX family membrane protein [Larkinella terrae]